LDDGFVLPLTRGITVKMDDRGGQGDADKTVCFGGIV
jgi:hypothetical protein